jgi:hypothetical protein
MEANVQTPSNADSSSAAYTRLLPTLEAMQADDTPMIGVDVLLMATLVMGCITRLRSLRDELTKLPGFDIQQLDNLDDYVRALQFAHGLYLQATRPPGSLEKLYAEGVKLRDVLCTDAAALIKRELMPAAALQEVRRGNGYRLLIQDLQVVSAALRSVWTSVAGRTAITEAELARADALVDELTLAVGEKDFAAPAPDHITRIRKNAYALFHTAYEEVRAAVSFVRRKEGDAATFAPSLFAARGARRAGSEDKPAPEAPATEPAAGDPPSGSPPLPSPSEQLATATFTR